MTKREVSEKGTTNCWMVEHSLGRESVQREGEGKDRAAEKLSLSEKSSTLPGGGLQKVLWEQRGTKSLERQRQVGKRKARCVEEYQEWHWKGDKITPEKKKVWPALPYTASPGCELKRVTSHSLPLGVQPSSSWSRQPLQPKKTSSPGCLLPFFRLAGGGKYLAFEQVQSVKKRRTLEEKSYSRDQFFLRIVSGVRYVTYDYTDKNAAALWSTLGMW